MTKKEMIKSIVVLTMICIVISGALALVNSFTSDTIELAKHERETFERQQLLPEAVTFIQVSNNKIPTTVLSSHIGVNAKSEPVGYVFTAGRKGFDGTVVVMTAIGIDGKIVRVSTIDVTSETKTLGGQAALPEYTDMYIGKDASLGGVNAISRATITSDAYEACVRDSFAAYEAIKEE